MMIVFVEHVPGEIMLLDLQKKEKRKRKQQSVWSKRDKGGENISTQFQYAL